MSKPAFAPIPMRALGDQRMTATHFRALAAISYRDRFGRNGQGCWASPQDLAALAACNATNLVTAISDLVSWGYISRAPRPDDKRKRVYRVVYTDQDHAHAKVVRPQANETPEIVCPNGQDRLPSFGTFPNDYNGPTPEETLREDIGQSPLERNSAEAGTVPSRPVPPLKNNSYARLIYNRGAVGDRLENIEGWLKAGGRRLTHSEVRSCRSWLELCDQASEIHNAHEGDPIGGWAYRLAQELAALLEDYPEEDE
jgi:DNA-binding MarR family transcriptional regulator